MRLHRWHQFDLAGHRFATVALDTTRDGPERTSPSSARWRSTSRPRRSKAVTT